MKMFLLSMVELGYLAMQFPQELSVYMNRMPRARILEVLVLFFASLSFATGLYQLRDYYSQYYLIHISVITSIIYIFLSLYFIFVSSYFDSEATSRHSITNQGKAIQGRSIMFLSSFPFWFFHPIAMLSSVMNVRGILLIPVFLLILFWSMYIQTKGLQYLYEITLREFLKKYVKATTVAILFPIVSIATMVITGILS